MNKILMILNFIIIIISIAVASLDTIYYFGYAIYLFIIDNCTLKEAFYESFKTWVIIFCTSCFIAISTVILHFKYLIKK